jgi:hypothetical protein
VKTVNPIITRIEKENMITAWLASADMLATKMILFKNTPVMDEALVLGDLTQPTGSWYTPPTVVATGPVETGGANELAALIPSHIFAYSGVDPSETITGFGLVDTAGANLLCAALLPSPVIMANVLDRCVTPPAFIVFPQISA